MTIGVVAAAALARKRTREDKGGSDGGRATGFHDEAAPYQGASSDFRLPEDMRAVIPEPPSYAPA
jgi:hypothetical protein